MCGSRIVDAWEFKKDVFYLRIETRLIDRNGSYNEKFCKFTEEE